MDIKTFDFDGITLLATDIPEDQGAFLTSRELSHAAHNVSAAGLDTRARREADQEFKEVFAVELAEARKEAGSLYAAARAGTLRKVAANVADDLTSDDDTDEQGGRFAS